MPGAWRTSASQPQPPSNRTAEPTASHQDYNWITTPRKRFSRNFLAARLSLVGRPKASKTVLITRSAMYHQDTKYCRREGEKHSWHLRKFRKIGRESIHRLIVLIVQGFKRRVHVINVGVVQGCPMIMCGKYNWLLYGQEIDRIISKCRTAFSRSWSDLSLSSMRSSRLVRPSNRSSIVCVKVLNSPWIGACSVRRLSV